MTTRSLGPAVAAVLALGPAATASAAPIAERPVQGACARAMAAVAAHTQAVTCTVSEDLTTNNEATTPADNSLPGVPPLAFTPRTDRQAISPDAPERPVPAKKVPGLQLAGEFAADREARWVLRLPDDWNGRLVTGVPSAVRSEYGLDFAFSDHVVQQGYAYVASNKGAFNVRLTTPADPMACALSAPGGTQSAVHVRAYLNDRRNTLGEWSRRTVQAAGLAKGVAGARHGRRPVRTYLVGVSAGGLTTRHVLETKADEFDGGVDWEGPAFAASYNLMLDYPVALRHWPAYRASLFDADSPAYRAMLDHGFPPDMLVGPNPSNLASPVFGSWHETHANSYWNLFQCLLVNEVDPSYEGGLASYDYRARDAALGLTRRSGIATSGALRRPLLTVAGTLDDLTLMTTQMRGYRRLVEGSGRAGLHRLYEVQNGGHIDRLRQSSGGFKDVEFVQPHAHDAFDRLVSWVEQGHAPPRGQCIPRGASVVADPAAGGRPEHCQELMVR